MNRRQLLVFLAVPSLVSSLGLASVRMTGATPAGAGACDPGSACCVAGTAPVAAAVAAPAADACGPGSCCVTTCCVAGVETEIR